MCQGQDSYSLCMCRKHPICSDTSLRFTFTSHTTEVLILQELPSRPVKPSRWKVLDPNPLSGDDDLVTFVSLAHVSQLPAGGCLPTGSCQQLNALGPL